MRQPYERLPDESEKAYEAFSIYRDLGVNRSLELVSKKLTKNVQLIKRWSADYNWVERVRLYDEQIDQQARKQLEKEAIQRKVDMLRRHGMAGRLLQRKAAEYLDKHGVDKAADAISGLAKGIEIERKAEGLPDWIFEVVNADDDELARQYHELVAQIGGDRVGDETTRDTDPGAPTTDAESE